MNITQLKEKVLWYTLDGEEGLILMEDIKKFVPFSKLSQEQIEDLLSSDMIHYCYAIQDGYHFDSYKSGLALEEGPITNPENEQKLLYNEYSLKGCQEADRYERAYIRTGGQYYDWNNAPLIVRNENGQEVLDMDRLSQARQEYKTLGQEALEWVDLGQFSEVITCKEEDLHAVIEATF